LFSCQNGFNVVSGRLYLDKNCDGTLTTGTDFPLPFFMVKDGTNGLPMAFTDTTGHYTRFLAMNKTAVFAVNPPSVLYLSNPATRTIQTDSTIRSYPNQDFRLCIDSSLATIDSTQHDLSVTMTNIGFPRPGFSFQMRICVENHGPFIETGVALNWHFTSSLAPLFTITDATGSGLINPDSTQVDWSNLVVKPFEKICFLVTVYVSATSALGTPLPSYAEANLPAPLIDKTPDNNEVRTIVVTVGSYDPNNKTTLAPTITSQVDQDDALIDYIIRFQNTGTAAADFVEVYDTVSTQLDLRTLRMVDASHAYVLSFPDANVLKWRFDHINLPDSASNPLGSQGFVRFKVAAVPGLELHDEIKNAVSIYFDFNTPVLTDTSVVTICDDLALNMLSFPGRCEANNGIAIANHGGGSYTYLWSTGSTAPKISGVPAGVYTVTVNTDHPACFAIGMVEVLTTPLATLQLVNLDHVQCFGQTNGSISVAATTGTQPFRYRWNTSDTLNTLTQLAPGAYTVTLTDRYGCRDTIADLQITQPNALIMQAAVVHQTDTLMHNGSISLTISGGTGAYIVAWSNGDTLTQIRNLSAGDYTVTITDAQGCTQTASYTIEALVGTHPEAYTEVAFTLQPNPVTSLCSIYLTDIEQVVNIAMDVHIIDQLGRIVYQTQMQPHTSTCKLDLTALPSAIYRVQVVAAGKVLWNASVMKQ
jgi:SprB repeat